ncbi:MAG: 30S ribosome-binding factor RbfA [Clostridia bacterium]|nr:30S ribosome-binding factor RbfA [Clostridia bacterium]
MNNRMLRADAEIQKELAEIIKNDLNDPRFADIISITWVKTSSDFNFCKVGVSVFNKDIKKRNETIKLLKKSSGYIKRLLADNLNLRAIPDLAFELDDGAVYEDKIAKILETLSIPKENANEENNPKN